ncbi:ATP phosphoribosyltransferase [Ramicandelaber brevisporus]|nr:ATP phosphoribosyltransferase [Ramicandelaber brevisporus]
MELVKELSDRLLFAIPKKGRLHEKCLKLLEGADVQFHRNPRHDIALVKNMPVALVFLPAADIAQFVGEGNVDLGITGLDIIAESEVGHEVEVELKLGFGKCKLQVQAPVQSAFKGPEDLAGKRIVTSFENLAKSYFGNVDQQLQGQGQKPTEIKFVSGSVEAACALGLADAIVDLVESGETMRAAGLHAIGTILETEAVLISKKQPRDPKLVQKLRTRIEGVITAMKYVLCTYNVPTAALEAAKKITPGRQAPSVSQLEKAGWVAVSVMVEKNDVSTKMDELSDIGATDIIVMNMGNCRV